MSTQTPDSEARVAEVFKSAIGSGTGRRLDPLEEAVAEASHTLPQEDSRAHGGAPTSQQDKVEPTVTSLANALARVFTTAVRELQEQEAGRTNTLHELLGKQQQALEAAIHELAVMKDRVGRLAATVAALEEADQRHESMHNGLREKIQELSASAKEKAEAFSGRLGVQQQEVLAVKAALIELSPAVAAISARLERHAEAIRAVCEAETMGETALDHLVEIWTRLKAASAPRGASKFQL